MSRTSPAMQEKKIMPLQNIDLVKRMLSLTILLGKQVPGFVIIRMTHGVQGNPSAYQLTRPMNCCWKQML